MSERTVQVFRALCAASIACLLVAARAPHAPKPAAAAPAAASNAAAQPDAVAGTSGVAAVVNDTLITNYDLNQRMALFIATSGMRATPDTEKRIRDEVLRSLVDEMLQLQEAKKNKITVTKDEVDKALQSIAKANNVSFDQITQMMEKSGINVSTLRIQLTAQLAWNKLVENTLGPRIAISDQDVDAAMARMAEGAHKTQYQVAEIYLGIDNPDQQEKILANANQLVQQLNTGISFAAAATQFSQSASAAQGGDIGWVQQGQLTDELDKTLSGMHTGDIAGPVRVGSGYYILQLRARREPMGTAVPKDDTAQSLSPDAPIPLARILLVVLPKTPDDQKQHALEAGQSIAQHVTGCGNMKALATQIQGAVYMNLGTMKVSSLSAELQAALKNSQPGEVVPPFLSKDGVEIIARCDPRVDRLVPFQMPTRAEMQNRLFNDQISMMARRYLRDLRRDAVVDYR